MYGTVVSVEIGGPLHIQFLAFYVHVLFSVRGQKIYLPVFVYMSRK